MKYILPGMGANSKMYTGPWLRIKDCEFINWPRYDNETSISDLANTLIKKYQISHNDIMIGSSLGGMVGLEIANITGIKRTYLVGSAMATSEISLLSKSLMPFANKAVVKISQLAASFSKDIINQMYSRSEPDFIVSMSKAILNWQGFKGDPKTVSRIHGKKDYFITCPVDCKILAEGGHLIALSHATECVDFIEKH